ncbi:hypothetical protein DFH06DRAFT_1324187 [Mycena polygramma]|nr:hypothetical protein DFH06DRAFT_1324187 [Mycena polygramma]
MSSTQERPYVENDLEGKRKGELAAIIRKQIDKWPESTFNESRTKRDVMVANILTCGFSVAVTSDIPAVEDTVPSPPRPDSEIGSDDPPITHPRSVDVLIEDLREEPSNKFIQQLVLPSCSEQATGEWLVDSNELLYALQQSPSALDGSVKLAFEDIKQPGWKRYFVKVIGSEALENASTSPSQLTILADCRFKIFVEHSGVGPAGIRKRERSPSDAEQAGLALGTTTAPPAKKRTSHADQADVDWLKTLLPLRPGYTEFQENQRKKLTNKDRVDFWRFAAQFASQYFNKPSGSAERQGKSVKKVSIEVALGMSATSLSEAEKMIKILEQFGENGEQRAQEVVDQANSTDTDGRVFGKFLDDWRKSHTN